MLKQFVPLAFLCFAAFGQYRVALGDWPDQRGPNRDGVSQEKSLPEKWSLDGENLLWRAPYGGRSAPVIMGNHLYVQNPSGRGADEQERVMCLDPDTGKVIWEYKFNVFQSDAPAHRVGWASPAVDPETGNVYAFGVAASWSRCQRRQETVGPLHRRRVRRVHHARRTHDVAADRWRSGDRQPADFDLGQRMANRAHRFIAMDKRTGEIVWVVKPGRSSV